MYTAAAAAASAATPPEKPTHQGNDDERGQHGQDAPGDGSTRRPARRSVGQCMLVLLQGTQSRAPEGPQWRAAACIG
jgi:hypothetical protein